MKICLSCEGVATTAIDRCAHCDVPLLPTSAAHFPVRRGESDAATPLLGSVIDGKFLIQGVLGRGGMGTVFRACHNVSLAPVALKLLHPRLSARVEYRRGLLAEARKAGRVVHDQCARVLDVGETEEGTVYLAMELCEGEPLDAWVRGRGLQPVVAVDVMTQICRALVAIHQAGLVHRDLSSRNVMVAVRDGVPVVKVLDFGIAQSLRLVPAAADERGGESAFANPVFSSPEHLAGQDVDARADLYSFGVLAYLLLTGRLPVDAHDSRAAARTTIAGRLLPMQAPAGVPRRLVRLVQRCLHVDRSARPASAAVVLQELQALARGRLPWLPRASLGVFALAVVVAIGTFARATPPFLRLVGGALPLVEGALSPDTPVHYLKSAALRSLSAHFGGFPAHRLEIEIAKHNTLQWRRRLQPVVDRDGALVLSEVQAPWREAIAGITRASADGPVDVAFVVPGVAVLGSVRLCVDDTPPLLELGLDGNVAADRLHGASRVHLSCRDDGGVADLRLWLLMQHGGEHEFQLAATATGFDLGQNMARILGPTSPLGPAKLELRAVDHAGNPSVPSALEFAECDFGAPAVAAVTSPSGEVVIPYLEDRARLRVQLSAAEPDLVWHVRDFEGRERLVGDVAPLAGTWYDLQLQAATGGEPFAAGLYVFAVEDAAGNRTERALQLGFRTRRVDAAFAVAAGPPVEIAGDEIVVGPEGGVLVFRCNPVFVPSAASVRAVGATPMPSAPGVGLQREGDRTVVTLAPLPPGGYQLVVELDEVGDPQSATVPPCVQRLTVLPAQLAVHLPEVRDRYLPPLLQANLFEQQGDMLGQGGALRVDAAQRRFLRGRVWVGADPASLTSQPLPEPRPGDARLLPPSRLLRGRNVFALEVHDVLGRPVAVTMGGQAAPLLQKATAVPEGSPEAAPRFLVADFFADPTPPQSVADELSVEYGQSLRLRLRCNLPFESRDLDRLKLVVGQTEQPAVAVRPAGSGAEVTFELPFAVWSAAAGLADVPRVEYSNGRAAVLNARLDTPANTPDDKWTLPVSLRTARTTLRVVQLVDVGERVLSPALASLTLVPVLAPESGAWPDPVSAAAPGRELFRPQQLEPVRTFVDLFVQDREFTLGQYAALLKLLPWPSTPGLWHADDPLQGRRLEPENMIPTAWQGDRAAFERALAATPEAAVTGVDFFQAYAASRLLGAIVAGDASLFRLPLGCELEVAAFGASAPGKALSGAAAKGSRLRAEPWRAARGVPASPAGPSAADAAAMGDIVGSALGRPIHSLDFGVREWVLDLAQGADPDSESLLREWLADRDQHVSYALQLAGGRPAPVDLRSRHPADVQARLRAFAVVRGLPVGEIGGLLDADGRPLALLGLEWLPGSVPGVVRVEQLRRDGRDLQPGRVDPRLLRIGFRVFGGREFVARMRNR